jgi:hypothetical protein
METEEQKLVLTNKQIYKKEYNARPEVAEKRNIANKKYNNCECGSKYITSHRKQHNTGIIHKKYLETGEKYVWKDKIK